MAECGCTNISIMQLFHELKQEFPAVPDEVVAQCIRQNAHNKGACERVLRQESQAHMVHTYPSALMTGTRRMSAEASPTPAPCGKGPTSNTSSEHCRDQCKSGGGLCNDCGARKSQCCSSRCCDISEHREAQLSSLPHPPQEIPPALQDLNLHISKSRSDPVNPNSRVPHPHYLPYTPRLDPPPLLKQSNPFLSGLLQNNAQSQPSSSAFPSDDVTVVDVNCSVSRECVPRHTAALQLQPMPHFSPAGQPRSYTSVNLTLRPPSSQPQPPIDIHSAGSSLTYSTSSYDPRQGYQSQLQIRIGPGGLGSVSAVRTRTPIVPHPQAHHSVSVPSSIPTPIVTDSPLRPVVNNTTLLEEDEDEEDDAVEPTREQLQKCVISMGGGKLEWRTQELLVQQLERRALLETELRKERNRLRAMQREVDDMQRDLEQRSARARAPPALPVMEKVQRLRAEILELQEECTRMANEVDRKAPDTRPEENDICNEPGWTCQICTFHNHPLLEACETCDVPRIPLGSTNSPLVSSLPATIAPSLAPALGAALASLSPAPHALMCTPNPLTHQHEPQTENRL